MKVTEHSSSRPQAGEQAPHAIVAPVDAVHAQLFHRQNALADGYLRRYAAELGLDVVRFDRDRTGPAVLKRVRRDVRRGSATGQVTGTPTLFIGGVVHRGSYKAAALLEVLAPRLQHPERLDLCDPSPHPQVAP